MSLIGAIPSFSAAQITSRPELAPAAPRRPAGPMPGSPAEGGFGAVFDGMIRQVETAQATANQASREVLLGQSPNLHQSIIARQEASLSFSLLVETRNKVVESYQELMRLPV